MRAENLRVGTHFRSKPDGGPDGAGGARLDNRVYLSYLVFPVPGAPICRFRRRDRLQRQVC